MMSDLGLHLLSMGISRDVEQSYYSLEFDEISVLGKGQFTLFKGYTWAGKDYAMSIDFDGAILKQILDRASLECQQQVSHEIERDPGSPRTITLIDPVTADFTAVLGRIQTAQHDKFVPFVIRELLSEIEPKVNETVSPTTVTADSEEAPRSEAPSIPQRPRGLMRVFDDHRRYKRAYRLSERLWKPWPKIWADRIVKLPENKYRSSGGSLVYNDDTLPYAVYCETQPILEEVVADGFSVVSAASV